MSSSRETKTALMDQIRRAGQLAFDPVSSGDSTRESYKADYDKFLEDTPTLLLLPALSTLLKSTPPAWFRPHISGPLSLLPLRPQGVRQIIEFLALMSPDLPPLAANERGDPEISSTQGPPLTPEAIKQASRLLASVPSSLTPRKYFEGIIPQLLALLDGEGGPDLSKAAGSILASDIGHKIAGWEVLAETIMYKIDPGVAIPKKPGQLGESGGTAPPPTVVDTTLVAEAELERALARLQGLLSSHPSLRLTKSLLQPLLLPLWAVLSYAKLTNRTAWYERASAILQNYFRAAGSSAQLAEIAKTLMWDGRPWWFFGPGDSGGIEVRGRSIDDADDKDVIAFVENIDLRVDEFIRLLASGIVDDVSIGIVFLQITRQYLLETTSAENPLLDLDDSDEDDMEDPLYMLVNTKLMQQMLENLKDKLASYSMQIFELARQLLQEYIQRNKSQQRKQMNLKESSYAELGNIINHNNRPSATETPESSEDDSTEIISIALSLFNAILSSPDFSPTPEAITLLSAIQPLLTHLSATSNKIPPLISQSALNLLSLIRLRISTTTTKTKEPISPDPHEQDRKTHSLALTNLSSPLPPIRAEGLSQISSLLKPTTSPVIDIPATTILLLSILQDSEEFIYLSAVRTLSLLASTHGKTVVRMLVERYVDPREEAGLDQRLRMGEALLRCVQDAGRRLRPEVVREVGEGMLAVAGRRGKRPKTQVEKEKRDKLAEKKTQEADEAWGGKVPQLKADKEEEKHARNEILDKILQGWEGQEGEEDVRIRASALSILGITIETNLAALGSSLVSSATDLSIAILTLENTHEKTILRRAAVLLLMSLIRALDKAAAHEDSIQLGFGFAGENLGDVVEVLGYVRDTDEDEMVRGHAETVVEGLETWRSKSLWGDVVTPKLEIEGERLAGLSVNPNAMSGSRPCIEEVD
ncbi:MAG: hypothetical protein M1835_001911 [Candelina submexicana]|nr:MAG: hypothetical protein M1835_001911 [Candelina submexicana]